MYPMSQITTQSSRNAQLHELVATNVRAEMAAQRKSTSDLASVLHMNQRAVQNRCSGKQPFSLNEVATIASWLGCGVSFLTAERSALAVAS
jgi:transcriptional regulator with XRE-family HTH domain